MELFIIRDTKFSRDCCFSVQNLAKIQLACWLEQFSAEDLRRQGWTRELLLQSCLQNRQFRIQQKDNILGLISYHQPAQDITEILFLATTPAFQNQGVMTLLLDQFLQANPGGEIWLECRADNVRARHLYQKRAFEKPDFVLTTTMTVALRFYSIFSKSADHFLAFRSSFC
jgi:ribosomal protein S18 acetylase RimI-like enzyme